MDPATGVRNGLPMKFLSQVRDAARGTRWSSAHGEVQVLTEIKARLADGNAIELRQPVPMAGFSGAAALDAQGQFVGMMKMRNFVLARAEPAGPPVRLVTATALRDFLAAQNVGTGPDTGNAKTR